MRTIGEKFMSWLTDNLRDGCAGNFEMVRADGSTDTLGRVDVVLKDHLHTSVLQFTYHFGPHSWHPIIIHPSGLANEDIQVFRWSQIDAAHEAIIKSAKEWAPLMI